MRVGGKGGRRAYCATLPGASAQPEASRYVAGEAQHSTSQPQGQGQVVGSGDEGLLEPLQVARGGTVGQCPLVLSTDTNTSMKSG